MVHLGYCLPFNLMRYKWASHGHVHELRPGWLERYENWKPGEMDIHPTCEQGMWNPEPFDKNQLPEVLRDHPYWNMEMIS